MASVCPTPQSLSSLHRRESADPDLSPNPKQPDASRNPPRRIAVASAAPGAPRSPACVATIWPRRDTSGSTHHLISTSASRESCASILQTLGNPLLSANFSCHVFLVFIPSQSCSTAHITVTFELALRRACAPSPNHRNCHRRSSEAENARRRKGTPFPIVHQQACLVAFPSLG
jgi:hypothetical protein